MTHIADDREIPEVEDVNIDDIPSDELDLEIDLELGDKPSKRALMEAFDIDPIEAGQIVDTVQATRDGLSPADRRQLMADINEVKKDDTLTEGARKEAVAQVYRNYDLEVPAAYKTSAEGMSL